MAVEIIENNLTGAARFFIEIGDGLLRFIQSGLLQGFDSIERESEFETNGNSYHGFASTLSFNNNLI